MRDGSRFLSGRCALITGSTAGIGLDTAHALGMLGADLVLNGLDDSEAMAGVCQDLEERHGVRVLYCSADLTDPENIQDLIAAATDHGAGHLDVLVNNAGAAHEAPVESFSRERWDWQLALNLSAPFHCICAALPGMRARGWGRIVNVASVHGLVGVPFRAGYVAAKHALVGLTKVVALETAGTSITCNAVCPGLVGTDRVLESHRLLAEKHGRELNDTVRDVMATRQPSGNYVKSSEVAAAIAYFCGPHASEIRGACLPIDGGWQAM
jgi:3-hydroxybutyrate dehydrogenase